MKYVPLIGRFFYSLMFIFAGFTNLVKLSEASKYAASMGVPASTVAVIISHLMILAGGLSILLGYKVKIGSLLLIIFLIPTTLLMHKFWGIKDSQMAQMQMIMFFKNVAMLGGAFIFLYFGSGPLSIEKQAEKKEENA